MSGRKKIILICTVLILAALAIAAYMHFAPGTATYVPANVQPADTPVPGMLVSATQSSVTIIPDYGPQKTFTIAANTQVITQATGGEAGKTLQELAAGTLVVIIPAAADATAAQSVSVTAPAVTPKASSSGPPVAIAGAVVSKTAQGLVLENASNSDIHIVVTKDTVILSNVLEGQKGKTISDIAVGSQVQVAGYTGTGGITAQEIFDTSAPAPAN